MHQYAKEIIFAVRFDSQSIKISNVVLYIEFLCVWLWSKRYWFKNKQVKNDSALAFGKN